MSRRTIPLIAVAVAFVATVCAMWLRHSATADLQTITRVDAASAGPSDEKITEALRGSRVGILDLAVRSVGGIVILKGTGDPKSAQQAVEVVKSLGVTRVANLISPITFDDEAIRREAERQLANNGSLQGCKLTVHCENGVLSVTGTVQHELQKDAARSALRAVRGAREVRVDLTL